MVSPWVLGLLTLALGHVAPAAGGILFPRASETREVISLDGVWKFTRSPTKQPFLGFKEQWYKRDLDGWIEMAVPSSYNDVTTDAGLRDYVGWVWYQRRFFAPRRWKADGLRVFVRFGSVHYTAQVWLNGEEATQHSGGHLPFQGEITQLLKYGAENLLTVAVNNTLTRDTIPQGSVTHPNNTLRYPPGYILNEYTFDFFNYAGIHRPVYLYTVPRIHIEDVTVHTEVNGTTGVVKYSVAYSLGENSVATPARCEASLLPTSGAPSVATASGCDAVMNVPDAELWWPAYMHPRPGHQYILQVRLVGDEGTEDVYRLPVGIRVLTWAPERGLQINGKNVYLRGFGKHEDSNIRGKGLDYALLVRDYNLMGWLGANAYRTSHYPYAEEALDLADAKGIMVIAESPAVNLDFFNASLLATHKRVMRELYERDKNRACVVMWSLSNEAMSQKKQAGPYYKNLTAFVRSLDASRPVSFVTNKDASVDKGAQFMDVIGVNHYSAWYSDGGLLDLIPHQVEAMFHEWYQRFGKLLYISEYGAGALAGLHALPVTIWTEDYQSKLLQQHFESFDKLREREFFIGEMVWNFADFATKQDFNRVVGNRKGLFTRDRQPKMAAHALRARYRSLADTLHAYRWKDEF